jgi:hypothetical protein
MSQGPCGLGGSARCAAGGAARCAAGAAVAVVAEANVMPTGKSAIAIAEAKALKRVRRMGILNMSDKLQSFIR